MKTPRQVVVLSLLALAPAFVTQVHAQARYPDKPIRFVVAIPAGGAPDIAARLIGAKIAQQTGQPVVVDNRTATTSTASLCATWA